MGKLRGLLLIGAGACVGTYALFPGIDTTADASPPQAPKQVIVLPPAPSLPTVIQAVYVADAAPRVPLGQLLSGLPLDRTALTREIQLQLKRAGCYHGSVDGLWSPTVRQSIKAFVDRVNAALPTDEPDAILLAMLQNHKGAACGGSCPTGQHLASDGRCLPNGVVTRTARKDVRVDLSSVRIVPASPSMEKHSPSGRPHDKRERMSLAGPPPPTRSARRAGNKASARVRAWHAASLARVSPSNRFPRWAVRAFSAMH
jgi:hypothetical protein